MLTKFWFALKATLAGSRLMRAVERNNRAADDLDDALRRVLRR